MTGNAVQVYLLASTQRATPQEAISGDVPHNPTLSCAAYPCVGLPRRLNEMPPVTVSASS